MILRHATKIHHHCPIGQDHFVEEKELLHFETHWKFSPLKQIRSLSSSFKTGKPHISNKSPTFSHFHLKFTSFVILLLSNDELFLSWGICWTDTWRKLALFLSLWKVLKGYSSNSRNATFEFKKSIFNQRNSFFNLRNKTFKIKTIFLTHKMNLIEF